MREDYEYKSVNYYEDEESSPTQRPILSPEHAETRKQLNMMYTLVFDRDDMTQAEADVADMLDDFFTKCHPEDAKLCMLPIVDVVARRKDGMPDKSVIHARKLATLIDFVIQDTCREHIRRNRQAADNVTEDTVDETTRRLMSISGESFVDDLSDSFLEFIVTCYEWIREK